VVPHCSWATPAAGCPSARRDPGAGLIQIGHVAGRGRQQRRLRDLQRSGDRGGVSQGDDRYSRRASWEQGLEGLEAPEMDRCAVVKSEPSEAEPGRCADPCADGGRS
jgi:hypothetical protein